MKIVMLTGLAGKNYTYQPGDIVDVEEPIANAWKKAGMARDSKQIVTKHTISGTLTHVEEDTEDDTESSGDSGPPPGAEGKTGSAEGCC